MQVAGYSHLLIYKWVRGHKKRAHPTLVDRIDLSASGDLPVLTDDKAR